MPSHIFTRLGLWEPSLASNRDSTRSAAEYTRRAKLHGHYDEGLHSIDYLMYAMLQTARDDEAQELLAGLRKITRTEPENFKVAYTYAASPARYALERHDWVGAARLELEPAGFPWERFLWAKSIHHFARGIGAARSGDAASARVERDAIAGLAAKLPGTTLPYWREQVQVHEDAVGAWILLSEGDSGAALRLAARAADREDAVDKHPVTPGEVLPARELLGDMLLESHREREALGEYRRVLAVAPNRFNALLGAARAAARSGDAETARVYYGTLMGQAAAGERGHAVLLEAGDDRR
jgi:hypothetical protein